MRACTCAQGTRKSLAETGALATPSTPPAASSPPNTRQRGDNLRATVAVAFQPVAVDSNVTLTSAGTTGSVETSRRYPPVVANRACCASRSAASAFRICNIGPDFVQKDMMSMPGSSPGCPARTGWVRGRSTHSAEHAEHAEDTAPGAGSRRHRVKALYSYRRGRGGRRVLIC